MLETSGPRSGCGLTGLLPQSNATSVESLWNNNQDFFGFSVITTGLLPSHISHRVRNLSTKTTWNQMRYPGVLRSENRLTAGVFYGRFLR